MTKKKNLIARICGLLIVLTLISCCFLGTTFARYTSGVDGTASVQVAKWDIDFTPNGSTEVEVGTTALSPDDAAWAENLDRYHVINGGLAMTIVNNSEVAADITVTLGNNPVFSDEAGNDFTGWGGGIAEGADAATYAEAYNTIRLQFTVNTTGSDPDESATWYNYNGVATLEDVAVNGTVYVYVRAVWDTQDALGQVNSDKLDTYLGENIAAVKVGISYTAVQSSELPA